MITLGVDDMDRAVRFYQHSLGFPRRGENDDVAFFKLHATYGKSRIIPSHGSAPTMKVIPDFYSVPERGVRIACFVCRNIT